MANSIQIEGLEATARKLRRIVGEAYAPARIRPVLLDGAEIVADEARANAPIRTGGLRKAIVAKLPTRATSLVAYAAVDMARISKLDRKTGKKVRYPYFVEYGVKKKGSALLSARKSHRSTSAVKAVHYFRNAVSSQMGQVKSEVIRGLEKLMRGFS